MSATPAWLQHVADEAAREAGGIPADLLGDYLTMLADGATFGRRPETDAIDVVADLGRRAAESGIPARACVTLYLSAARLVWADLPAVIRERDSAAVRAAADAVLFVAAEAVAMFTHGYAEASRLMVRQEESIRRQVIDDLLAGSADLGDLAARVEPFGIDLAARHQVALARADHPLHDMQSAAAALERIAHTHYGGHDVLVAATDAVIAVIVPAGPTVAGFGRVPASGLGSFVHSSLSDIRAQRHWRVAVGRPHAGPFGIARSHAEARDGLALLARGGSGRTVVTPDDLLVYRVLLRDQPAIADLIEEVLGSLADARGGAGPLVRTLSAYFAEDCVATRTAARLGLSVRATTYRLERIHKLTGYDPTDPADRYAVHTATLGAELLGWPEQPLPASAAE